MKTLYGYITSETASTIRFVSASASRMNAEPVATNTSDIVERIDLGISPADIKVSGGNTVKVNPVTLYLCQ